MFNDLTKNQDVSSSGVDDIFAETDKTPTTGNNIETRQVGLSSLSDMPSDQEAQTSSMPDLEAEKAGSGKLLKIAIFAIVGAILILGGYLVYTNFLSGDGEVVIDENAGLVADNTENKPEATTNNQAATTTQVDNQNNNSGDFVTPIVDQEVTTNGNDVVAGEVGSEVVTDNGNEAVVDVIDPEKVDADGDGLSDYDEVNIHGTNPNLIDTDMDGLSDYDEVITYKTDPLKVDTDTDGLNDYNEVKVYSTDPLKADTDGDGYLDGAEVDGGYDPLDASGGRLPGF